MSSERQSCGKEQIIFFGIKLNRWAKKFFFIFCNSLEYEGIVQAANQKDLAAYAMDRYAYYVCFKCSKAYYGGEARCDAELGDKHNPQELICGGCSDVARAKVSNLI